MKNLQPLQVQSGHISIPISNSVAFPVNMTNSDNPMSYKQLLHKKLYMGICIAQYFSLKKLYGFFFMYYKWVNLKKQFCEGFHLRNYDIKGVVIFSILQLIRLTSLSICMKEVSEW